MTVTLADLRRQSRDRSDMKDSTFVTDSELNEYINSSIAELHDILIQSYDGDYVISEFDFTTVKDVNSYNLPTDFYKLRGIDLNLNGSEVFEVPKFNFNERNRFDNFGVWDFLGEAHIRYRLVGSKVRFSPAPDRVANVKIWYIPVAAKLVLDADTFDDINAYSEYVVVDAAIKMMQKEESDVTILFAQKVELKKRIEDASKNRDAGHPDTITDVDNEGIDFRFFKGGG